MKSTKIGIQRIIINREQLPVIANDNPRPLVILLWCLVINC